MRSWLVAMRIARREARRAKGRTLLVIAMIAMPILALSFASVTYDSMKLSPAEQRVREIGAAGGTMSFSPGNSGESRPPTAAEVAAGTPSGVRLSPYFSIYRAMRTAGGIGTILTRGIDTADPMTKGIVRTIAGRTPVADDEVAVTAPAMSRLDAHIGGTVYVYPRSGDPTFSLRTYRVVGIVEIGGRIDQEVLFRPSQAEAVSWYYQTSGGRVTSSQRAALRAIDIAPDDVSAGHERADPFNVFGIGAIIAGLGILEVVLLAGPAFAVGAKRRQRDLALASANGATPSTIRRIVLADGVFAGVLAAVCGIAVGIAGAVASRGLIEEHLVHRRGGAFDADTLTFALISVIAIGTGLLGALVPAFTAARQNVIEALSGRRGTTRSHSLWLVIGLAGVAIASGIAYLGARDHSSKLVLTGLIIREMGLVLCTPKLLGFVSHMGSALPLAPRIALRDTARRRASAAPAISAIMAAVAGSVALTVYLSASDGRAPDYTQVRPTGSLMVYMDPRADNGSHAQRDHRAILKALGDVAPTAAVADSLTLDCDCSITVVLADKLRCPYENDVRLSADDQRRARADKRCDDPHGDVLQTVIASKGADLRPLLGLSGSTLARAATSFDDGKILVTDPRFIDSFGYANVQITFDRESAAAPPTPRTFRVPAMTVSAPGLQAVVLPASIVTGSLETKVMPLGVVADPATPLDQRQRDALDGELLAAGLDAAQPENGPPAPDNSVALILALAAGVVALGAAAIATGLAAADGRADLMILGAVGASPRVRRMLSLAQAGVIAFLGSLLGVVAGFGAAAAVITGLNRVWSSGWPAPPPYSIAVPWLNLFVSLLIVPAVAMLGAGLLTSSRLPSERRAD
jgi:putative ABC transport system permease protein